MTRKKYIKFLMAHGISRNNANEIAQEFNGGICLILRLCPTDYHRFHFVDNGTLGKNHILKGSYYSVNPVSVERIPKLFCQNKREWSIFKSENSEEKNLLNFCCCYYGFWFLL